MTITVQNHTNGYPVFSHVGLSQAQVNAFISGMSEMRIPNHRITVTVKE